MHERARGMGKLGTHHGSRASVPWWRPFPRWHKIRSTDASQCSGDTKCRGWPLAYSTCTMDPGASAGTRRWEERTIWRLDCCWQVCFLDGLSCWAGVGLWNEILWTQFIGMEVSGSVESIFGNKSVIFKLYLLDTCQYLCRAVAYTGMVTFLEYLWLLSPLACLGCLWLINDVAIRLCVVICPMVLTSYMSTNIMHNFLSCNSLNISIIMRSNFSCRLGCVSINHKLACSVILSP